VLLSRKLAIETAAERPSALPADPTVIPPELAVLPQWVAWQHVRRHGRWTKLPIDPASRRPARSNQPSTWRDLPSALAVPEADGVGFMFSATDPYCGIDLDDCRDPESGRLSEEAQAIVAAFDTYTEISPSATGVKLFLRATLPGGNGRKFGPVEMYDRGRYFAVTGRPPTSATRPIRDCQDPLLALIWRLSSSGGRGSCRAERPGQREPRPPELPDPLAGAGSRLLALFAGDRTGYDSPSNADLALCGMLIRHLGDAATPSLVDALFRESRLMRPKWDERRGELTYGELTLHKAFDQPLGRRLDIRAASDIRVEPLTWLWEPWLARGTLAILDGDPGLGKSSLTIDLIARVTTGRAMPGSDGPGVEPHRVIVCACEDSAERVVVPRLTAAAADLARVHVLGGVIETTPAGEQQADLQLPRDLDLIADWCRLQRPALVVIDPLFAVLGLDANGKLVKANDDQSVRKLTGAFRTLAEETGAVILAVRHLNKAAGGSALHRGSGSIALAGQARSVLLAGKDPQDPDRGRVLAGVKSNLGPLPRSRRFTVEAVETTVGPASRIAWGTECDTAADELVKPPDPDDRRQGQRDRADDFLRTELAAGPKDWDALVAAAEASGLAEGTLRNARTRLGLIKEFRGRNKIVWRLLGPGEFAPLFAEE
jgi:hypothetical protein